MIETAWTPRGLALSEQDVVVGPFGRTYGGTETPTMSGSEIATGLQHSAPSYRRVYDSGLFWIEARLAPLLRLPQNWDTNGAQPISELAAADTRHLMSQLLRQNVIPPELIPLPDGGISIEWRRPTFEFSIDLPGETGLRSASAYCRDTTTDAEWEQDLVAAMPQVIAVLGQLVDNHSG